MNSRISWLYVSEATLVPTSNNEQASQLLRDFQRALDVSDGHRRQIRSHGRGLGGDHHSGAHRAGDRPGALRVRCAGNQPSGPSTQGKCSGARVMISVPPDVVWIALVD